MRRCASVNGRSAFDLPGKSKVEPNPPTRGEGGDVFGGILGVSEVKDVVSKSVETKLTISTEFSCGMFAFAALDADPV